VIHDFFLKHKIQIQIERVLLRVSMYIFTAVYQVSLFRNLQSQDFIYWSIISLLTGVIGYFDLGVANQIMSRHLQNRKSTKDDWSLSSELNVLIELVKISRNRIVSALTCSCFASVLFSFISMTIFLDFSPSVLLYSICVLLLNVIMYFVIQFSSLLGRTREVLFCQLLGSAVQALIAFENRNLTLNLLALGLTPIFTLLVWITRIRIECAKSNQKMQHPLKLEKGFNGKMQAIQILGLSTTLSIQYLPTLFLSTNEIATFQLQLRMAFSIIAVVATLNMSALRDVALIDITKYLGKVKIMLIASFGIALIVFGFVHVFWNTFLSEKTAPSLVSLTLFIIYVLAQPYAQCLYYFLLGHGQYNRLLAASALHLVVQTLVFMLSVRFFAATAIPLSMLSASILSAIPLMVHFMNYRKDL
jgi:hypothetical protein